MSGGLDQTHIRRAFGRAALTYERHAVLQAEIGARLRERIDTSRFVAHRVLDVGCGAGRSSAALRALLPEAEFIALDLALPMLREAHRELGATVQSGTPAFLLCADAQALPIGDVSVDLVHANLCLQWCEDPGLALAEFHRVLRPGGLLLLSTFGPDTLQELRSAFSHVDGAPHVSRFIDMHTIGDALLACGLRDPVLERDDFVLTYASARELMRDLRRIGATNADTQRSRALTGKTRLQRVVTAYENFRRDDVLPATYEVIYAQAWAAEAGQSRRLGSGDLAAFPIEHLRGSRRGG